MDLWTISSIFVFRDKSMNLKFSKYHGSGNDFIMVDNRDENYSFEPVEINELCKRRKGIGADGLILIENAPNADFKMIYFNADGFIGSMCGNGGRCAVSFAKNLGIIIKNQCKFFAFDGIHHARYVDKGNVSLKMTDVTLVEKLNKGWKLDTGSPHLILFRDSISQLNVKYEGFTIRNSDDFVKKGINVNFVELNHGELYIRTYERGVEDETLSCGTGAVASAIVACESDLLNKQKIKVNTLGGQLEVSFSRHGSTYSDIHLIGPTQFVFNGEVDV